MNRKIVKIGIMGLLGVLAGCEPKVSPPGEAKVDWSCLRVGEYNTRAVALAWGRSKESDREVQALMAEHKKAKAAGDTKRMKELETMAKQRQDRRHRQVFGDAPIPDVMARLRDDLPEIARQAGVQVIVARGCYQGPPATVVDITDRLVEQFHPTGKTRRLIRELEKHPPIQGPIHCR